MTLHAFAKLFPRCINTDGSPRGLKSVMTCLIAYSGSQITQFGTLDTAIYWTPKGQEIANHLQTQWHIADTPGPTILGFPSCAKLGQVELNCADNFQKMKLVQQTKSTRKHRNVKQDIFKTSIPPPLNTKEDHNPGIP